MKSKHILIFLLTFILSIGSVIPVYANDNTTITQSYYDIANRLKNNKVLTFKSASLKLDESVTRQEAVSVVLDLMGYNLSKTDINFVPYNNNLVEVVVEGKKKNGEKFSFSKTYNEPLDSVKRGFNDVPEKASQNYKDAIVMAKALGIVHGYKGNFAWNETISAQDMYLLMLRVLNYKDESMAKVTALGLNKNIYVENSTKLNRGQMYQIIYNTLLAKDYNTKKPLQDMLNVKVDDTEKPVLEKIDVYSQERIVLTFNEEIKKVSTDDITITNHKGEKVQKFSVSKLDSNALQIKSSEFVYDERYTVRIINIEDKSGNLTTAEGFFIGIKKDYTDFNAVSVNVLFGNEIRIRFNKDIDKYSLTTNSVEIKELGIRSVEVNDNYMIIKTEPMVKNKSYELNFKVLKDWAGNSLKNKKYTVQSNSNYEYYNVYKVLDVRSIGEDAIKVIYGYDVDKDFVENIKNYRIDKGLEIKEARLLSDNRTVILTTSKQSDENYTLEIRNKICAANSYYSHYTFRGMKTYNNSYLYISSVDVRTNNEIEIRFSRAMDIESVMNTDNITIDGLDIFSVEPVYYGLSNSDYHKVFRIKTNKQSAYKYYKINFANLTDEYGNALNDTNRHFYGKSEDKVAPTVSYAYRISKNQIKIYFTERVTKESAENISNYKIYGISTPPMKATLSSDERSVTLEVDNMVMSRKYTINVSDIEDLAGNAMEASRLTLN